MSPCPRPETLGRLADASTSASNFLAVEAHVEACPDCQGVLERLAADSSACEDCEPERVPLREQPPTIPGFMIERELGRGGMGVVYQAWQPQLARRVAIKVVSASVGIGTEDRRRWLREAQAIGRVRHPNVVQLHEAGEQDGCLYLVLDLIAGGSLADRVTGPLPARVAVGLMATVARAVDQIHRAGMLHLDIKPSNILLDGPPDGPWDQVTPMLADFGIARAGDDPGATATGPIGVRGTPSFMAPEQIVGDRAGIGPRSDVFALGATLYCLLTGRPPFQAASVIETIDLVRTRDPAPLRTLVPDLPRDLETIAQTCLRKDPRRRYASACGISGFQTPRIPEGFQTPIREGFQTPIREDSGFPDTHELPMNSSGRSNRLTLPLSEPRGGLGPIDDFVGVWIPRLTSLWVSGFLWIPRPTILWVSGFPASLLGLRSWHHGFDVRAPGVLTGRQVKDLWESRVSSHPG
jgi:eukaryotic-like serine/threonine-protein kinase